MERPDIEAMRIRTERATFGKWKWLRGFSGFKALVRDTEGGECKVVSIRNDGYAVIKEDDAEFILHSRPDMEQLLDYVEHLEGYIQSLHQEDLTEVMKDIESRWG